MRAHCLFEQSGTFKNEFIKLGIDAKDYDIKNEFGETDVICDLYEEIQKAYRGGVSVFDEMSQDDLIMAFFPCTRFESNILLGFRGELYHHREFTDIQKLEYDLKLHKELSENYELVTKLVIIAIKKRLSYVFRKSL